MTSKVLAEILTEHGGFQREGDRFAAPTEVDATLFASIGRESLVIERVVAVQPGSEIVIIATSRKERYAIAFEDVRALRFSTREAGIRATGY